MNVTFKQVQPLPRLDPAIFAAGKTPPTFHSIQPPQQDRQAAHLAATPVVTEPLPRLARNDAEEATFAILTLSAVLCVGQAIIAMIPWSASVPQFTAWVAQLIG